MRGNLQGKPSNHAFLPHPCVENAIPWEGETGKGTCRSQGDDFQSPAALTGLLHEGVHLSEGARLHQAHHRYLQACLLFNSRIKHMQRAALPTPHTKQIQCAALLLQMEESCAVLVALLKLHCSRDSVLTRGLEEVLTATFRLLCVAN